MNDDDQRTLAVWAFFVLGFAGLAGVLLTQGEFSPDVAVLYWVTVGLLTLLGVVTPPWDPFVD